MIEVISIEKAKEPIVRFAGVSKKYGAEVALHTTDLTVSEGELVVLLGPNGAGKTTTISLMLGLIRPTTGKVTVGGGDPTDAYVRAGIGAMLQNGKLSALLTVREHIEVFASYYPHPLPLQDVLERANLVELAEKRYGKISGGERKRVQFAIAICGNPRVVYLDEPTANLDVESRRALHVCIRNLTAEGRTVLFSTHHLEEADQLATRVIVLDKGRVVRDGTPAAIKAVISQRRASCRTRLAEDAVRAIPGVTEVHRTDGRLELSFETEAPVARELYRLDPDLVDLVIAEADLEEAFVALVGNRDGKEARS